MTDPDSMFADFVSYMNDEAERFRDDESGRHRGRGVSLDFARRPSPPAAVPVTIRTEEEEAEEEEKEKEREKKRRELDETICDRLEAENRKNRLLNEKLKLQIDREAMIRHAVKQRYELNTF